MILILDLDDTIYETATIRSEIIKNGFAGLQISGETIQSMMKDFGRLSTFEIFKKHNLSLVQLEDFYQSLVHQKSQLTIKPFEDYGYLKAIDLKKYLVTTGYSAWQQAKIDQLSVAKDFIDVMIHIPGHRHTKKHFFKLIQEQTGLPFHAHYVIGDNPHNELRHGYQLGMKTIQRLSPKQPRFRHADYVISDFSELAHILY
jgi:putative hydrolase of the HAD superfamily